MSGAKKFSKGEILAAQMVSEMFSQSEEIDKLQKENAELKELVREVPYHFEVITRDKIIEAVGKWNDRKTTNEDDLIEFLLKELGL